jgi:hypothetical protein
MNKDIAAKAVALVDTEIKQWENSVVYITEKVAFRMRDLIRVCNKNYWGIFDDPKDPLTGRPKIWYPLSEEVANAWADNADLDQKDVGFRSKPGGNYAITQLTRQIIKDYLDTTNFGQDLDDSAFRKAIEGTAVWKVINQRVDGKNKPVRKLVNLLNFYIDPTADSIQQAYRVTERALYTQDEIEGMSGWDDTKALPTDTGLANYDPDVKNSGTKNKYRDVYELWGKIPGELIGEKGEIDGHIVVSGLEAGEPVCHLIEKNAKKDNEGNVLKPYEEDWAMKVPGRWYGRGPVEQVMFLQLWINTIINIRINRSYVSQLGLWKIKRGANITAQSIQKLGSNGAVLVTSMDDIEQMVMQEASQASYTDENNIRDIAKRITRTLESVTGERMPASMPATNAAIQSNATKNAFTKIKERSGFFVERMINRHLMGLVMKNYKKDDLIRILHTDHNIDEILDRIAYHYVEKYMDELEMAELYLTPQQLEIALAQAKEQLKQKPELFIKNTYDLIENLVDCSVYITNEELDMGSMVDKLIMGANLLPEQDRGVVVRDIYDLLGIPYPQELVYKKNNPELQQPGMMMPPQGGPQGEVPPMQGQRMI